MLSLKLRHQLLVDHTDEPTRMEPFSSRLRTAAPKPSWLAHAETARAWDCRTHAGTETAQVRSTSTKLLTAGTSTRNTLAFMKTPGLTSTVLD